MMTYKPMSYEAWRISFQSSEQAARAAFNELMDTYEILDRYQNGYQGGCYACETVATKNIELEMKLKRLASEEDSL